MDTKIGGEGKAFSDERHKKHQAPSALLAKGA